MIKLFKSLSLAVMALTLAALASCSDKDKRDGDVRDQLLGFVPDKTGIVISMNPQKILQSAGGDWTEDEGIVFGPYIDGCIAEFGGDKKEIEKEIGKFLKIKGLNRESIIYATDNGLRDWFILGAVSDKEALESYLKDTELEKETIGDFDVYGRRNSYLLLDNADRLIWSFVSARDAEEAVKSAKSVKSRAATKAFPDWTFKYVGSGDNFFGVVANFSALGVNLNGLMRMADVPADLLGGDIDYMALAAKDVDHKASFSLVTLDANGANVPLLNPDIYKNADLSAINELPAGTTSMFGLGISGKEVFEYLPQLRKEIGDKSMIDIISSITSVAFGVASVDTDAVGLNRYGNVKLDTWPVKGGAVVVKCDNGKSADLFRLLSMTIPNVETADANTLKFNIPSDEIRGLDAVYFSNQHDCILISTENLKAGGNSADVPSNTLAYSYADSKVYSGNLAFASQMVKYGKSSWDADGIHGEVVFTDDCPGALALVCKVATVYIKEAMNAQRAYNDVDDYDEIFAADSVVVCDDDVVEEIIAE